MAPIPMSMMMIAITHAKIGRSMKTRDMRLYDRRAEFWAFAPAGGTFSRCGALAGTGFTVCPSRRLAVPCVMTFSPGAALRHDPVGTLRAVGDDHALDGAIPRADHP